MLRRLFLIIECGIMHFLCMMHVGKVQASSSSSRLPLWTNFVSFAASIAELAHREKSCTHSCTHPTYLMRRKPICFLVLQPGACTGQINRYQYHTPKNYTVRSFFCNKGATHLNAKVQASIPILVHSHCNLVQMSADDIRSSQCLDQNKFQDFHGPQMYFPGSCCSPQQHANITTNSSYLI